MAQPDGFYPRVNAEIIGTKEFDGMVVSVVGRFGHTNADGTRSFECADGRTITVNTEYADNSTLDLPDGSVIEVVGQVSETQVMMFVTRELSADMDLSIYNKMIQVQQNPKFKQYFAPC